jgi:hypothetical protein
LHTREASVGVDLEDPVHVLREVDDDRNVARLPREARPAAARDDRRVVISSKRTSPRTAFRNARSRSVAASAPRFAARVLTPAS